MLLHAKRETVGGVTGTPQKILRVLHIVEKLNDQAVETWLLRVLSAAAKDYPNIHWTFFCVLGEEGKHDSRARELGAEVIHSRYELGDKINFIRGLRDVMKRGRYDILHCHHDVMSAVYLTASVGLPIKKRIVHAHNTSMSLPTPNRMKAQLVREPMRQICLRMADEIVGPSEDAICSLVGNACLDPSRHRIVHYAIDTARFSGSVAAPGSVRTHLGISSNAKLLLFVGRMVEYKNPQFILDMLAHLNHEYVAAFAGTGDQEQYLFELARSRSMLDRVRFLGFRNDVPDLMFASDLLIWPSLEEPKEGLGLGIIEAQAAGLPVLMSLSVPLEAIVNPELITVLPLSDGGNVWAETAVEILNRPRPNRADALTVVESSSFSMATGVDNFMRLYDDVGQMMLEPRNSSV